MKIVALDADLAHATVTLEFAKVCPERFFNAGIAEANMVSMVQDFSSMGLHSLQHLLQYLEFGRAWSRCATV